MINVWRIGYCAKPTLTDQIILSTLGYGSTQGNGRWHIKGPLQVVYAGSTRALCQLEKRVHSNGSNPKNQVLMRLELPGDSIILDIETLALLPLNWKDNEGITQVIGMNWLTAVSSLGLWVPSYVEPLDRNLLINPAHYQYPKIKVIIERNPFKFDPRLF